MSFVLAEFNILRPEPGLFVWTLIFFLIFWFLIGKFAFKPIANALVKRENHIQDALLDASKAKEELRRIQEDNSKFLDEARVERAALLKQAKENGSNIIEAAKREAEVRAGKIIEEATIEIENRKKEALRDVKNQVSALALDIAESVMKKNLSEDKEQVRFVNELVEDIHLS